MPRPPCTGSLPTLGKAEEDLNCPIHGDRCFTFQRRLGLQGGDRGLILGRLEIIVWVGHDHRFIGIGLARLLSNEIPAADHWAVSGWFSPQTVRIARLFSK